MFEREPTDDSVRKSEKTVSKSVMQMARTWSLARSKDPSTKVGAAVYCPTTGALHLGYNGFPSGVPDFEIWWQNRDDEHGVTKYDLVTHAEANAIRKAWQANANMDDAVLFVTHRPCHCCVRDWIAPSGIKLVIIDQTNDPKFVGEGWQRSHEIADLIYFQCGIRLLDINSENLA